MDAPTRFRRSGALEPQDDAEGIVKGEVPHSRACEF